MNITLIILMDLLIVIVMFIIIKYILTRIKTFFITTPNGAKEPENKDIEIKDGIKESKVEYTEIKTPIERVYRHKHNGRRERRHHYHSDRIESKYTPTESLSAKKTYSGHCDFCGEYASGLDVFYCKYCNHYHCKKHRIAEDHECTGHPHSIEKKGTVSYSNR